MDPNTANNANLNATENNDNITPDDNGNEPEHVQGAGVATPEDTPSAEQVIIKSQQAQIEALTAHIDSLNEQIAHIIRNGGSIGTPLVGVAPDTGNSTPPEQPAPDFAEIAKGFIK